jgi:hypothetical protein
MHKSNIKKNNQYFHTIANGIPIDKMFTPKLEIHVVCTIIKLSGQRLSLTQGNGFKNTFKY